ncbi:zinc finger BED domain-containing protein RICESLEEPER 2-like protein [Tanacetum coccineum]
MGKLIHMEPTFEMFESGLKQKTTLAYFHDILVNKNGKRFKKFPVEYWVMIEMLNPLLEVFQNAMVILSWFTTPTSSIDISKRIVHDHFHPKDFATFDVLGFWKAKENQFPVLSHMAMDILSVQASSVASELTGIFINQDHLVRSGARTRHISSGTPIDLKKESLMSRKFMKMSGFDINQESKKLEEICKRNDFRKERIITKSRRTDNGDQEKRHSLSIWKNCLIKRNSNDAIPLLQQPANDC